ncbi:hypothetical protein [Vibrio lentus]|uniref:Uncharacterized protein n=4 Tax=Vibrio lentus TaxID=136468 RepID=A0AA44VPJ4_9VIBR|nr:hypothetical protein [Vibrio lentus]
MSVLFTKINMNINAYIKTALVAVLFISYHLNGLASDLNSVQCLIKNENVIITFDNTMMSSFQVRTRTNSQLNQNTNSGTTRLILNRNQLPAVINITPEDKVWEITPSCAINPLKKRK